MALQFNTVQGNATAHSHGARTQVLQEENEGQSRKQMSQQKRPPFEARKT
jgi:hypothetical protein